MRRRNEDIRIGLLRDGEGSCLLCASRSRANQLSGPPKRQRRGFTLLEMCIVLLIIALLTGVMMPSIQSLLGEAGVRNDSRQLALMVRTAMLQSSEQHRPYVIDLTSTNLDLHPADDTPKDADSSASASDTDAPDQNAAPKDLEMSRRLDSANKLLAPDPQKANTWIPMPTTSWFFRPGELCPATQVRLARGQGWIELSFNALTGEVETESAYFP